MNPWPGFDVQEALRIKSNQKAHGAWSHSRPSKIKQQGNMQKNKDKSILGKPYILQANTDRMTESTEKQIERFGLWLFLFIHADFEKYIQREIKQVWAERTCKALQWNYKYHIRDGEGLNVGHAEHVREM